MAGTNYPHVSCRDVPCNILTIIEMIFRNAMPVKFPCFSSSPNEITSAHYNYVQHKQREMCAMRKHKRHLEGRGRATRGLGKIFSALNQSYCHPHHLQPDTLEFLDAPPAPVAWYGATKPSVIVFPGIWGSICLHHLQFDAPGQKHERFGSLIQLRSHLPQAYPYL